MPQQPEVMEVDLYQEVPARIQDLEEDPDNIRLENNPTTVEGLSRAVEYFGRYDVAPRVWATEDGKLRALAGSGRVRAAKEAQRRNAELQEIPVIRVAAPKTRADKVFLQFSENALRDTLGPVDYGRGFKMLAEEGLTYDQILEELRSRGVLSRGRTKAWVSQMIQLTELDSRVQRLVNRGEISVWQALQLRSLDPSEQRRIAERAAREALSRSDLRFLVTSGGHETEAALQETRDKIQEAAASFTAGSPGRRARKAPDAERQHGQVSRRWTLLPAVPRAHPARSKLAALERSEWFRAQAGEEERQLAVEAVSGGHAPEAAIDLVRRAVVEAPAASQPMRDLLVILRQAQQAADMLQGERGGAPAEFARLRLRALLKILG